MTAVATTTMNTVKATSRPHNPILRIVKLHTVNPSVFFGIPWIILVCAWAVTMAIAAILTRAGVDPTGMHEGMRNSWAVLAPQWYLVVVGVQAVSFTFPFALGFGATRRDFWFGTSAMFVLVSCEMAIAIATLVQIEIATGGWGVNAAVFDALWYGRQGWLADFYATFCLQLLVLFIGAAATTVYMRWRARGMLLLGLGSVVLALLLFATITFTESWGSVIAWLAGLGMTGAFTLVLAVAAVCCAAGYLVIRRATTR